MNVQLIFLKSEISNELPFSAEVKNMWNSTSTNLYEGSNFNSGNYLFTTDTK